MYYIVSNCAFLCVFSRLCYDVSIELSELLGMARWYEKYGVLGLSEDDVQGMCVLKSFQFEKYSHYPFITFYQNEEMCFLHS